MTPAGRICEGRIVAITGAGRGLGRAYALEFARQGAAVVVNDVGVQTDGSGGSATPARAVVEEIRAAGGVAVDDHHDISGWESAAAFVQQAVDTFGRLDVLVNNAGILRDRSVVNMTESEWDDVVRVHLKGTMATTRAAAVHWRARVKAGEEVHGRIVNTTSSSGIFAAAGQANYAAAKAGIAALTIVAARELERYGVTANAIYPTAASRLTEDLFRSRGLIDQSGELADAGAHLDPANIAPAVVWLGSTHSSGVTGRVLGVRGDRLVVAEGWQTGPTGHASEGWASETIGSRITELVAAARPNANTDGTIPGSAREPVA